MESFKKDYSKAKLYLLYRGKERMKKKERVVCGV